jgi:hypothetical protein
VYLYTAGQPDPDLLIRTSGELRISNFLLWQIAYAEIWVTEVLWPTSGAATAAGDLDFQKRERRYGGIAPPRPRDGRRGAPPRGASAISRGGRHRSVVLPLLVAGMLWAPAPVSVGSSASRSRSASWSS